MSNELCKTTLLVEVDLDLLKKILSLKPKVEAYKNADSVSSLLSSEEFISDTVSLACSRSLLGMQIVRFLESQPLDSLLDN